MTGQPSYARRSARVILIDDRQRVLLMRFHRDLKRPERGFVWFTPGGGVDRGETLPVAAARELFEETGLRVDPAALGPVVAYGEGHVEFDWLRGLVRDDYFFHRVPSHEVDWSGHQKWERKSLQAMHWWSVEELRAATEEVVPHELADLVASLTADEAPAEPLRLGWHH